MNIEEIDNITKKESKWDFNEKYINNKPLNILIKIFSFFSILFSLSIINELFKINLDIYLVIIFGIFLTILIILNEYLKIKKLIDFFSKNRIIENGIISIICILISIIISCYGIYKFLDKRDDNYSNKRDIIDNVISDTTLYFNNKIDSINNLNISDVKIFNDKYNIYQKQLDQYIVDRDNYKNKNMTYNNELRNFYIDINNKIDEINENIINLNSEFDIYKINEISNIKNNMNDIIFKLNDNINETKINMDDTNKIIIYIFVFLTLITEIGIVYIAIKIASTIKYNNELKIKEEKLYNDKISFIKTTKEFKKYDLYKLFIERLYSIKSKNNSITISEINNICNSFELKSSEIKELIIDFKSMGIISESVKRIGSKLEMDKNESIFILKKYFEPIFNKY